MILSAAPLKAERMRERILAVWKRADVHVFARAPAAMRSVRAMEPQLLIAELSGESPARFEHLALLVQREVPILIVVSGTDGQAIGRLRRLRFEGVFDATAESLDNLPFAVGEAMDRQLYVSASIVPLLLAARRVL
jgi:hypothetical protein